MTRPSPAGAGSRNGMGERFDARPHVDLAEVPTPGMESRPADETAPAANGSALQRM
jgi:hypothetical protein